MYHTLRQADTSVNIVDRDRNCANITFTEAFLFSNKKPKFYIKLRGEAGGSGPRNWFQKMMGGSTKFLLQKAMNFKLLTTKHLAVHFGKVWLYRLTSS